MQTKYFSPSINIQRDQDRGLDYMPGKQIIHDFLYKNDRRTNIAFLIKLLQEEIENE